MTARRSLEVLAVATRLGLTSFGGPVAHLGYFREELVRRRGWLDDDDLADVIALGQALPGPASSQVLMAIGMLRAGALGGLAAWVGFTAPSAVLMLGWAAVARDYDIADAGWVHGLQVAAVAIVAQAVWNMGRTLATGRRLPFAVLAALVVLALGSGWTQLAVIIVAAAAGTLLLRVPRVLDDARRLSLGVGRRGAVLAAAAFVALAVGLPLARLATDDHAVAMAAGFFAAGALVFGGGHVVLPLLADRVVDTGWVSAADFVSGYGAAQALPGPLFTFAAYLGAVQQPEPNGIAGGLLALVAIFLPGALLLVAFAPAWDALRRVPRVAGALAGIGAAVVGLLAAALWDPVIKTAIDGPADVAVALVALGVLVTRRVPPVVVVAGCALAGVVLG